MFSLSPDDRLDLAARLLQAGMTFCIVGLLAGESVSISLSMLFASLCIVLLYMVARSSSALPEILKTGALK
jgi:hypothetical protein